MKQEKQLYSNWTDYLQETPKSFFQFLCTALHFGITVLDKTSRSQGSFQLVGSVHKFLFSRNLTDDHLIKLYCKLVSFSKISRCTEQNVTIFFSQLWFHVAHNEIEIFVCLSIAGYTTNSQLANNSHLLAQIYNNKYFKVKSKQRKMYLKALNLTYLSPNFF